MVSTTIELNKKEYEKVSIFHRFLHNNRLHEKCKNSIFDTKYNYVKNFQNFENEEEITKEEEVLKKYVKKKTKRSSQLENHILESTINISRDEEIEKYSDEEKQKFLIEKTEKYIETLKEKYGIKIYQYRIHLDEGQYKTDIDNKEVLDENGEKIMERNIHVHLIHSNVTSEGKSFIREVGQESFEKYRKRGIHIIQNLVRENFDMTRGQLNSGNKHLNKQQYVSMIKQSREKRKIEIEKIEQEFKKKEELLQKNYEMKKIEIKEKEDKLQKNYEIKKREITEKESKLQKKISNEDKNLIIELLEENFDKEEIEKQKFKNYTDVKEFISTRIFTIKQENISLKSTLNIINKTYESIKTKYNKFLQIFNIEDNKDNLFTKQEEQEIVKEQNKLKEEKQETKEKKIINDDSLSIK